MPVSGNYFSYMTPDYFSSLSGDGTLWDGRFIQQIGQDALSGVSSYSNTNTNTAASTTPSNNTAADLSVDIQTIQAVFNAYGKNGKMNDTQIAQAAVGLLQRGYTAAASLFATLLVGGVAGQGLKPPDIDGDGKVGLEEMAVLVDVNGNVTPDSLKTVFGSQASVGNSIDWNLVVQKANASAAAANNPFQLTSDPYSDNGASYAQAQLAMAQPLSMRFNPVASGIFQPFSAFSLLSAFTPNASYVWDDGNNVFSPAGNLESAYFDTV